MEFKKCNRCGSFFASNNNICPNCISKENSEFSKLKSYFNDTDNIPTVEYLSKNTGISENNIIKYLNSSEFNGNF